MEETDGLPYIKCDSVIENCDYCEREGVKCNECGSGYYPYKDGSLCLTKKEIAILE